MPILNDTLPVFSIKSQDCHNFMGETKLQRWVNHLSQSELPIFKYSLIAITTITSREDTSSNELSSAILKDINLTARILRLSNSYIYNPSSTRVNTITHAVMILGFNLVRDISISLSIIDTLLKGNKETHVMKLMARTFHAAVQAREIAEACNDDSPEEIFIAALLYNIGELTFCCVEAEASEKLINSRLLMNDAQYEKMQNDVLGFTFNQLSEKLTQDWQLSSLLNETISNKKTSDPRCQHIIQGNSIAMAAEHGWQSAETNEKLSQLSKHIGKELKETSQFVHKNTEAAVQVAQEFGARDAAEFIPSLDKNFVNNSVPPELEEQDEYLMPDHMLQLSILRELSSILSKKPSLSNILTMVLEGIYRGIGMDRAVLVFLNPAKTEARAKIALGIDGQQFQKDFTFNVDMQKPSLFQQIIMYNRSFWIQDTEDDQKLLSPTMKNVLNTTSFFISPISIQGKTIGFFYADRQPSNRELNNESYESFKHFTQEACIALKFIKQNG